MTHRSTRVDFGLDRIAGRVDSVTGAAVGVADGLPTTIALSDGTTIQAAYWRLLDTTSSIVTSFDHGHGRGGPPIDAVGILRIALLGRASEAVSIERATGDLMVRFADGPTFQAFRLRSLFEDWELRLNDGEALWSNMVEFERTGHPPR